MPYEHLLSVKLQQIRDENRYRKFVALSRIVGNLPYATWHNKESNEEQEVIVWCTNDYLGMSHHKEVLQAFKEGCLTYGVGSGGTRNISGTAHPHVMLEQTMADLHKKEAGLLFVSGYAANEGALSSLANILGDAVIFSDEKNHASIIQGIKLSKCEKRVYAHNDMAQLEEMLKEYPIEKPKIIVVVSVSSMRGDFAPLRELCALKKKYNALLFVDEVHAVGMYGPRGAGLISHFELEDDVDIIQGNFAKGYGVIGGYIAASSIIIESIRLHASSFIFTTSIPPAVALASQASVKHLAENDQERQMLWKRVKMLKKALSETTVNFVENESHMVPVIIGDAKKCLIFCYRLLNEHGIYVQPINYPTVPIGQEMIRLTVTPFHTEDMILELVESLQKIWTEEGLPSRIVDSEKLSA
ncbi:MAG: 5-aminolevulinate synthase [Holosporales bacterium]